MAMKSSGKFQLIAIPLNDKSFVIARCDTETGEGHYRVQKKWQKGAEENPIGRSAYICAGQAFGNNGWLFIRMDLNSGQIWTLQKEVWRTVLK